MTLFSHFLVAILAISLIASSDTPLGASHQNRDRQNIQPSRNSLSSQESQEEDVLTCYNLTNPDACGGNNGSCLETDECECVDGFGGDECDLTMCFGFEESPRADTSLNAGDWGSGYTNWHNSPTLYQYLYPSYTVDHRMPTVNAVRVKYRGSPNSITFALYVLEDGVYNLVPESLCLLSPLPGHGGTDAEELMYCPESFSIDSGTYAISWIPEQQFILGESFDSMTYWNSPTAVGSMSDFVGSKPASEIAWYAGKPTVRFETAVVVGGCSEPNGHCIAPDTCECVEWKGGDRCDETLCYGLSGVSACSWPNGSCTDSDECTCDPVGSYAGLECEFIVCHSKTTAESDVCGHPHGTCIAPGTCVCDSGYGGAECLDHTCNLKLGEAACSFQRNLRGC